MEPHLIYTTTDGRKLTREDLKTFVGEGRWEVRGGTPVPAEAQRLHDLGRAAGQQGDYDRALALLDQAHNLAPTWPYPRYDAAFTTLLRGDTAGAAALYEEVDRLAPRGFFTCKVTLYTLRRELAGELFPGFTEAFVKLEWITARPQKGAILRGIVEKYPDYPPAWKELSGLLQEPASRLHAVERGLAANPDPDTRGGLLINRAIVLQQDDRDAAIAILAELALDPSATLGTEMLAKSLLSRLLD